MEYVEASGNVRRCVVVELSDGGSQSAIWAELSLFGYHHTFLHRTILISEMVSQLSLLFSLHHRLRLFCYAGNVATCKEYTITATASHSYIFPTVAQLITSHVPHSCPKHNLFICSHYTALSTESEDTA